MEKIRRLAKIGLLMILPFLLSACFGLQVVKNVKKPERYFKRAYRQIEKIHEQYPNREGRTRSIHVLIYDCSERKIIQASAPVWMVNACMDMGTWAVEESEEFDFEERYDFDLGEIRDLDQIGPGLLVEVNDEKNKILIWLE